MRRTGTGLILGYHGCDQETADKLVGGEDFHHSKNDYDWLGFGVYFWENDPERALYWAREMKKRGANIRTPSVVGAVIDPGWCLDITTQASLDVIRNAYEELTTLVAANNESLVENKDFFRRNRDCAVFNFLHRSMPNPKFQTIRGILTEGGALYDGALILSRTHVQLAVRDPSCIKGVFHVKSVSH